MSDWVFGILLRDVLLADARTPHQLAEHLEVRPATVARWLQGQTIPNSGSLAKLLLMARERPRAAGGRCL